MEFYHYLVGSSVVILGNDSKKDVFILSMYQLKLHGGNKFPLPNASYAPKIQAP